MSTVQEAAIRAATADLSGMAPHFAARFAAAQNLLLRGGWTEDGQCIAWPSGVTTTDRSCGCTEGVGPNVCLHRVAARILAVVRVSRTPPAPACGDCGADLTPASVARIGKRTLTICRTCHRARQVAGRRRQIAADEAFVARAIGT